MKFRDKQIVDLTNKANEKNRQSMLFGTLNFWGPSYFICLGAPPDK